MTSDDLFNGFCKSRNIKESTIKSYTSAIKKYEFYNRMSISQLIDEAVHEEEDNIPLKKRKIKRRLLDFRACLSGSPLAIGTVRTYFSRIKTFDRNLFLVQNRIFSWICFLFNNKSIGLLKKQLSNV